MRSVLVLSLKFIENDVFLSVLVKLAYIRKLCLLTLFNFYMFPFKNE